MTHHAPRSYVNQKLRIDAHSPRYALFKPHPLIKGENTAPTHIAVQQCSALWVQYSTEQSLHSKQEFVV
jgi:hypothetical protein